MGRQFDVSAIERGEERQNAPDPSISHSLPLGLVEFAQIRAAD